VTFKTEQETFWAGQFGNEYSQRNRSDSLLASNLDFFSKALRHTRELRSCIEFGANIGMNIKALKLLYPGIEAHAIEINAEAAAELKTVVPIDCVYNTSVLDFIVDRQWDLALVKGVLIHINPSNLTQVYDKLVASTRRYLMVAEYYNRSPVSIAYRGHSDKLFKRDFVGEIMDIYPYLQLLDYGFVYHRDPNFSQDDVTWFLLEKR